MYTLGVVCDDGSTFKLERFFSEGRGWERSLRDTKYHQGVQRAKDSEASKFFEILKSKMKP